MGKTVQSPVKRFPGSITLRDPLTFALVAKWEEAIERMKTANKEADVARLAVIEREFYPLVFEFVETWDLKNMSPESRESFPNASPGTSARSIHALVAWLISECQKIYNGNEDSDPNE